MAGELTSTPIFFGEIEQLWRTCGCGARIVWARTTNEHRIALDADEHGHPVPTAGGRYVVLGRYQPPVVRIAQTGDPAAPRFRAHASVCPESTHLNR